MVFRIPQKADTVDIEKPDLKLEFPPCGTIQEVLELLELINSNYKSQSTFKSQTFKDLNKIMFEIKQPNNLESDKLAYTRKIKIQ